jgi:actin-like ATPase involved in cell morphogenesis
VFRSLHSEWSGRAPVAVDLGTSRTQVFAPTRGLLIDEPTLLAWDRSGQAFAAGREARQASVSTGARLSCPVRRGLPVGPINCVRYLSLLFKRYGLRVEGPVVLAIPAVASLYEASVLAAVPASATGARILPVGSPLAAALGAGLPMDEPVSGLICDVGAGVLELGAIGEGRLLAQSSATVRTTEYLDDPERLVVLATGALHRLLDKVPSNIARELVSRPLHVVGGGALLPGLDGALANGFQMEAVVHDEPRHAVIKGLTRCLGRAWTAGDRRPPNERPGLRRDTPLCGAMPSAHGGRLSRGTAERR